MKISPIIEQNKWEDLFKDSFRTDIMQTWAYGEAVNSCIQWEPIRYLIEDKQGAAAIAQILIKEIPLIGKVVRIQHGPLFNNKNFSSGRAVAILDFLKQYYVDENGCYLHLTPCLFDNDLPAAWFRQTGFSPSNESIWASVRIDLKMEPEQIRRNMKRKWRNPLKKSLEVGLEFEICDSKEERDIFLKNYHQAAEEKGFSWPSAKLISQLWNQPGSKPEFVCAEFRGERIAMMVPMTQASTCFSFAAWNGPQSKDYHAHNFLIWNCIIEYRKRGYRWLDLGGIDHEKLPGITKFKRNTGGEEYRLAGNFEAAPSGLSERLKRGEFSGELGDILYGQRLPGGAKIAGDEVSAKVMNILQQFVSQTLNLNFELDDEISLVDGGIIDSLSLVTFIQILQEAFDIRITPNEITIENFDTAESISSMIKSKFANK